MPVEISIRQIETDPMILPLTINDLPADLTSMSAFTIVYAGYDGRLKETAVSGATVTVYAATSGLLKWALTSGQIDARYSPYRVWVQALVSGGGLVSFPADDYFLIYSRSVTYG